MVAPVWTTTAGKLATIDEQVSYSLQLEANTGDSTAITYSVIAGSLPSGMILTSTGLLQGSPAEVRKRTLYTFVVRATAGTSITDRTFKIDVQGADAPSFSTAAGQLNQPTSEIYTTDTTTGTTDTVETRADITGNITVLDGTFIEYQLAAQDTDTQAGQSLIFELVQGAFPPGVTMTKNGLISGIVGLTDDEKSGPVGGYDGTSTDAYDDVVYDRTVISASRSVNYDFIVRVTDGTSWVERNFNIFVYSADYWVVSNTLITIDQTRVEFNAATMDLHTGRPPVFITPSDLGTFRHDNQFVAKIDVSDFDPQQADLEYSIVSGSLPTGVSIDVNSGELFGTLARQSRIEETYNFTIKANRTVATGISVFAERPFTMKVIGEVDIGIIFRTPAALGTISAGIPCLLSVEAFSEATNRELSYNVTAGILPPGITLSPQGNFIGTIDPSDFTDSTRAYTFTVTVSDQYESSAAVKEFTINIDIPFTTVEYGNMTGHSTSFIDQNIFFNIAQDPDINSPSYIYRPDDPEFGMKSTPSMLLMAGLESQTLTTFQNQMEQNHAPKTLYFGDLKTAIAKQDGIVKYEVVYVDMKDPMENSLGKSVASSLKLRDAIVKPILGPRVSSGNATTDLDIYEITTDGGLSFSTSGSKVRYANQLSADLGFIETLYPNAVANMRSRMKSLGHKEWTHLPLWMRTAQSTSGVPLGFVKAVPICFCKPGTSALVKKRIADKTIEFKNIHFIIDKYRINKSKVNTNRFTADGSTTSFVIDELVHDQEILIEKQTTASDGSTITVERVFVGDNVTADNNKSPTYLSADGTLRSSDFEREVTLSHNTSTTKTTMVFAKAPDDGVIITVDRTQDKYLAFRNKGI
jgi:hypothetical protein